MQQIKKILRFKLQFDYFCCIEPIIRPLMRLRTNLDENDEIWMKWPSTGQATKILLFEILALLMYEMHANLLEKCKLISKRKFTVIVVKLKKKTRQKLWKEYV